MCVYACVYLWATPALHTQRTERRIPLCRCERCGSMMPASAARARLSQAYPAVPQAQVVQPQPALAMQQAALLPQGDTDAMELQTQGYKSAQT